MSQKGIENRKIPKKNQLVQHQGKKSWRKSRFQMITNFKTNTRLIIEYKAKRSLYIRFMKIADM